MVTLSRRVKARTVLDMQTHNIKAVTPLQVNCPWCHSSPGEACSVANTSIRPHGGYHQSRLDRAKEVEMSSR